MLFAGSISIQALDRFPDPHMDSSDEAKMKNAVIVGDRVFLRPPERRDLEEFISLNRASARSHRGLVTPPTQPDQFNAFLKRCRRTDCLCLLVCRVDDGLIVGSIDLSQIFRGGFQNAYLGYYVVKIQPPVRLCA